MAVNRTAKRQISFRLTETEFLVASGRASGYGLTPSKLARRLLLDMPPVATKFPVDRVHEVITELKHIGNNVNQIAHRLNTHKDKLTSADLDDIREIRRSLRALWQSLN